ncbi:MAG TPA: tRNA lysidine(34) synthetase TilS [Dehalococcoidia bacterium]|nr:tRNA lysidine(34) synthetase TilS [Dehalococcoidia bacterium]
MSIQIEPNQITLSSTKFTAALERRVLHFIRKHHVITLGERAVVAVSGGPDSTALLIILARLSHKLRLDITVAHFNHLLRSGEETTTDLQFVQSLASSLELSLAHSSGDVPGHARDHHLSIEDAARRLRYAFLIEQAKAGDASCVAVGHTLDDQAETILLHLIRGAGLSGIAGMLPRAPWPFGGAGPELARPLLFLRRRETQRYCREVGVIPRDDPTNDLLTATRNRVRHDVMADLRSLNPRIEEALVRFAGAASEDADYLDQLAAHSFTELGAQDETVVSIPRLALSRLPRPLAARVIQLAFAGVQNEAGGLEAAHIEALLEALTRSSGRHSLPGGVTGAVDRSSLTFSRGRPVSAPRISLVALPVPGRIVAGAYAIEARLEPPPATPKTRDRHIAYLDAARTGLELIIRSRRPGDRLRPLGLGGEKKLQDILVDARVPATERDSVPLVCGPEGIIWIPGHCIDQRYALGPHSKQALHLTASQAGQMTIHNC